MLYADLADKDLAI